MLIVRKKNIKTKLEGKKIASLSQVFIYLSQNKKKSKTK